MCVEGQRESSAGVSPNEVSKATEKFRHAAAQICGKSPLVRTADSNPQNSSANSQTAVVLFRRLRSSETCLNLTKHSCCSGNVVRVVQGQTHTRQRSHLCPSLCRVLLRVVGPTPAAVLHFVTVTFLSSCCAACCSAQERRTIELLRCGGAIHLSRLGRRASHKRHIRTWLNANGIPTIPAPTMVLTKFATAPAAELLPVGYSSSSFWGCPGTSPNAPEGLKLISNPGSSPSPSDVSMPRDAQRLASSSGVYQP